MKLGKIIKCSKELSEIEISGITCDSRKVSSGYAFVCINGVKIDGHKYLNDAINKGASVIICDHNIDIENQIIVSDTRAVYADMCSEWFGNPAKDLKLLGVTGTNGKTSVTYMLKSIIESAGYKVGLIGTIQNMIGNEIIATHNTTPNAYELNSLFALMKAKGCAYVIMEVSSHALDQNRVYKLDFDVAMFTNLTQDHLDYHITMDNYLAAKKKLFKMCKTAVINSDDSYSDKLCDGLTCKIVTYSKGNNSTYSAKGINYKPASVEYEFLSNNEISHVKVNTGGSFSVYNSMCALVCAVEIGIPLSTASSALATLSGVKGRAEVVPTNTDYTVIIDYAHTPDGLKNILSTFEECKKNRLIVLFGCGGDRDKGKRPIMGDIAVHYADYVIVTSDNPRTENPSLIIKDILNGMTVTKTPYKVIENRKEAIKFALSIAQKDDIIVLAGKGHETYQILNSGTIHLDEREVIADVLKDE